MINRLILSLMIIMPAAWRTPERSIAAEKTGAPATSTSAVKTAEKTGELELALEEKIGQLIMVSADSHKVSRHKRAIESGLVGGVLLQWGSFSIEETKKLTEKLQGWAQKSPAGLPLIIAADYEGGTVFSPATLGLSDLPTNMMLGAARDETDTASLAYLAGAELKRAGIHMNFGPVLDVNTQKKNPVIGVRSISSDPELVAQIGAALINGFKASGIIPVAKHFPGHGASPLDSHKTLPVLGISKEELQSVHLKPFIKAIECEVPGMMTAHIVYTELDEKHPATLSEKIIGNLLRRDLGFAGFVISDSLDMKAISAVQSIQKAAVGAITAGVDIVLIGNGNPKKTRDEILKAVNNGKIPVQRIEQAWKRVLELKKRAGLLSAKKPFVSATDRAYLVISKQIAEKAVTLVKNEQEIIPLQLGPHRKFDISKSSVCIIVFSPPRFADDILTLTKTFYDAGWKTLQYTASVNPAAIEQKRAMEFAKKSDILIIGSFQWVNVSNSRQVSLIKSLLSLDKPAILVSLMSPYDIEKFPEAETVLAVYGITRPSMEALGKIILGKITPKGKLPVSISK